MIVTYGLISRESGNRLASATRSHGRSCTRPQPSVTDSAPAPMAHPPIRCAAEIAPFPSLKWRGGVSSVTPSPSFASISGGGAARRGPPAPPAGGEKTPPGRGPPPPPPPPPPPQR